MTEPGTTLLHITDLHLLGTPSSRLIGVDTADSLRAVLEQAFAEATPRAVLATGDIAHHGEPAAYQRFADILGEFHTGPLLVLPGNHDYAEPMAWLLADPPELQLPGWRIIGMDSHVDDSPGAELRVADVQQLKAACVAA